jgi:hypothetical protein
MPSIDYRKRATPARPAATSTPAVSRTATPSEARKQLRYWVDQYHQLTGAIEAAQVTNHDQWRKERINTRDLYSRRASAAARMAHYAQLVLDERP